MEGTTMSGESWAEECNGERWGLWQNGACTDFLKGLSLLSASQLLPGEIFQFFPQLGNLDLYVKSPDF